MLHDKSGVFLAMQQCKGMAYPQCHITMQYNIITYAAM